jgi:hypothetical protein
MTTPPRTNLLCDDPGALIAAVPGMLSFHPVDSVILITYTGEAELSLESVLRMDLPLPEHVADVARQLRTVATNHEATVIEVIVLGGGGADPPTELPHRDLVEHLADAFEHDDIVLAHAIWSPTTSPGATWWCYEDPECAGQVCPATRPLAAHDCAPFATREDMAELLTPDPVEALAPRAAALALEHDEVDVETDYRFVRDTVDQHRDPHTELDDPTILRLIRAISTADIREACLALPLTVRATAAEQLWLVLTRATPGRARAHPASLLAVSAYLRGEGTLATMAIDAALTANPRHHLANTLRHTIDCGIPPAQFRTMLAQSLVSAFTHSEK